MNSEIEIPYFTYEQLRQCANIFIARFHPSETIPIPIEEIIDLKLKINIIPLPGLHRAFEIDGFTSSDLRDISVDEFVYESRVGRYRFTLAHEVGHIVLHKSFYQAYRFRTIDEWKYFVKTLPEKDFHWLEWQANCFAGLVLVPKKQLMKSVYRATKRIKAEGISLKDNMEFAWDVIVEHISEEFSVSKNVIETRIYYDKLRNQF